MASSLRDLAMALMLRVEGGAQASAEIRKFAGATDQAGAASGRAAPQADANAKAIERLQASVKRAVGKLIGVSGLAIAIQRSSANYAEFSGKIAEVSTLLDDTSGLEKITAAAREMAREYGTAPVQQAQALYDIISAGAADSAQQTQLLTAANKLARGGITDVGTAADGLTSILNAYGLKADQADRINDALFATMRAGKTTIGELSGSLGQVTPLAAQAGIEFEEVAAAVATLTKGGVSTSQSVTQLRGIISSILKPTAEAAELAEKLGLKFDLQALKAKGLSGFLADVRTKTGGNAEQMSLLFGQVEALGAALALTGTQAEDFGNVLDSVQNSAGETEKAVAKVAGSDQSALQQFRAIVTDLSISLGNLVAKGLVPVAKGVSALVLGVQALPEPLQTVIGTVGALTAAMIALRIAKASLLPLLSVVAGGMGTVATATTTATAATVAKTAAVRALSLAMRLTPWGLAATAALGLGSAIYKVVAAHNAAEDAQRRQTKALEDGIAGAQRAADANAVAGLQTQSMLEAIAAGVDQLSGAQRQFYAANLVEAEQYLRAQIAIGVREQELHGQTQINLKAIGEQLRAVRAAQEQLAATVEATKPLTQEQVIADGVIDEFRALGDEIEKTGTQDLAQLQRAAEASLGRAREEAEALRAKFPQLANASESAMAVLAPGLAAATERVRGLGDVIDGVRAEALRRLGVDAEAVLTGIDVKTGDLLASFRVLAADTQADAGLIQAAFEAVLKGLDTPAELESLKASLAGVKNPAFDAADAVAEIEKKLQDVQRAGDEAANAVADAFQELGIKSSASLKQQADEAKAAYELIRRSGVASAGDIQRAEAAAAQAQIAYKRSVVEAADDAAAATRRTGQAGRELGPAFADGGGKAVRELDAVADAASRARDRVSELTEERQGGSIGLDRAGSELLSSEDQALLRELRRRNVDRAFASANAPGYNRKQQNDIVNNLERQEQDLLAQLLRGGTNATAARKRLRDLLGVGPEVPDSTSAEIQQAGRAITPIQVVRLELPAINGRPSGSIDVQPGQQDVLQQFLERLLIERGLSSEGA